MTWTKVAATATCDLVDPGWTNAEAPESACDLTPSAVFVFEMHDSSIEDDYEVTTAGWTLVRMESVCDG